MFFVLHVFIPFSDVKVRWSDCIRICGKSGFAGNVPEGQTCLSRRSAPAQRQHLLNKCLKRFRKCENVESSCTGMTAFCLWSLQRAVKSTFFPQHVCIWSLRLLPLFHKHSIPFFVYAWYKKSLHWCQIFLPEDSISANVCSRTLLLPNINEWITCGLVSANLYESSAYDIILF